VLLACGGIALLGFRQRRARISTTLVLVLSLSAVVSGYGATIMPVGPITFSANASYDANFKEASINPGNTRNANGYVQLQGFQYGPAVYDTSATGGSNGSGGSGGNDANKDLSSFTISGDLASSEFGEFGLGFLLRLNTAEANGYFAAMLATGPNEVRFDLFEGAGLTQGFGSNIFPSTVTMLGLTFATNRFYPFKVTVLNGDFTFNFGNGAATANFTDTTLSASTGQVGFVLLTASPSAASRLDNFAIVPEPNAASLAFLGLADCLTLRFGRSSATSRAALFQRR